MEETYSLFIKWLVTPEADRPAGQKDLQSFCNANGITKEQVGEYKKYPSYNDDYFNACILWSKSKIPSLLHKAHKKADESGDLMAIEKYTDIVLNLDSNRKKPDLNKSPVDTLKPIDDEKFNKIAQRFASDTTAQSSRPMKPDLP